MIKLSATKTRRQARATRKSAAYKTPTGEEVAPSFLLLSIGSNSGGPCDPCLLPGWPSGQCRAGQGGEGQWLIFSSFFVSVGRQNLSEESCVSGLVAQGSVSRLPPLAATLACWQVEDFGANVTLDCLGSNKHLHRDQQYLYSILILWVIFASMTTHLKCLSH